MKSLYKFLFIIGLALFGWCQSANAVVLKIATLSPEGSLWMQEMRRGAAEVAQKTNNRIRFKFYPGGVMGNEKAVLHKMRIGQLHGGTLTAGSLSNTYPNVHLYSLPLKFKSFDEIDFVRQRMDAVIVEILESKGLVNFGLAEGGFAYLMSKNPIRTMDDLRQQKVWIPDHDQTSIEAIKSFGIQPIPLPIAEVRASLQTGLIDTVTVSPIGAIILQWHTQVKYMNETPLLYTYGLLVVDRKAYAKIAPEDETIVRAAMTRVFQELDRKNRQANIKASAELQRQGVQLVKPTAQTLDQWHAIAVALVEKMISRKELTSELVKQLDENINTYRRRLAKEK